MFYDKPMIEVLKFEIEDVIRTSNDDGSGGNFTPVPGPW